MKKDMGLQSWNPKPGTLGDLGLSHASGREHKPTSVASRPTAGGQGSNSV